MIGYTRAGKTRGTVLTDMEMTIPLALKSTARSGSRLQLGQAQGIVDAAGFDLRGRTMKRIPGWNIRVTP
jgi:hypothetical protein